MAKLDQRIQLVASNEFSHVIDEWRRDQTDLPSRSEAIRRLVELGLRYEREHPMQMITAVIRPHKYEQVREALLGLGVQGMTVTQVSGFGRQRGQTEIYRGAEYKTSELPKVRLERVSGLPARVSSGRSLPSTRPQHRPAGHLRSQATGSLFFAS